MRNLDGKVALIIGGGSSIGRGMAAAFAEAGMKVVIADVDVAGAELVAAAVSGTAIAADATRIDSVRGLADRVYAEFSAVHLLCNNAEVDLEAPIDQPGGNDWAQLSSGNVHALINAVREFVPRMKAQGGEAHIVNTAAMGGHLPVAGSGLHCATQAAVIGISEVLRLEGSEYALGVSILCLPAAAPRSASGDSGGDEDREGSEGEPEEGTPPVEMDPDEIGRMVVRAVERNDLYVIPAGDSYREQIEQRMERIMEALQ